MTKKQLLGGRYAPLTFAIGFLNRPLDIVSHAYLRWRREDLKQIVQSRTVRGGLEAGLSLLEPLVTPHRRELFLATESAWTAYFDNGCQGGDPFTPISLFAEMLECRGLIAISVPHSLNSDYDPRKGTYGSIQFQLFGPEKREFLNYERTISASFESKWRFDTSGTVQPFEETAAYTDRSIRDRFTPEMLERYCAALGIRLFDDKFYCGPGVLIDLGDPLPTGSRPLSLREAREELGLA